MILKFFETEKINIKKNKFILFYGKNEGLKKEEIKKLLNKNINSKQIIFDEKKVLENEENFFNEVLSGSLFDANKSIIIKNCTDKILKIIEILEKKNIEDNLIIINSEQLDKKSKLRKYFEQSKDFACIAFYPDTVEVLNKIAINFFKQKKISISQSNINFLIERSGNQRENLFNEIEKIEMFYSGKTINFEHLLKLTNLSENYAISELVDYCLAKNIKKTLKILNENNLTTEDGLIIVRTFLNKTKRLLNLLKDYNKNKDLNFTLQNSKPPIFWKDKELIKEQILKWRVEKLNNLIFRLNNIELDIKKNINNSIYTISDFIISTANASN